MAEITKQARRRAKTTSDQAEKARSKASEQASDAAGSAEDGAQEAADNGSSGGRTITSELKDTFREAAIEVLRPVMRQATTSAAKYAVKKGPGLMKDKVVPKLEEAGGAGAIAKGLTSKGGGIAESIGGVASGIGGKLSGKKKEGESPSGSGRGRRLPVQEVIDVGVDLQTAYDQFTQFEDWPKFMHRVERIEQRDDSTLMWHENIWGVRRSWEAEITDQTPCERIAWRSKGGPQTVGVATFHRLSDNLTRIMVTMDFQPKGLFEKTASGTRISRRALSSDLMRFKGFIELQDEATGEWRGQIEDGEVVDEERDDEEPRDEARDEPEDEELDEPEAAEDEEYEEPEASEDEEEEEPLDDEEYEEPEASEDEEEEEPLEDEDEEEEPKARGRNGKGRFQRDEDEDEPEAEAAEEEEEEAPRPRRRRRTTARAR
jgi:uncharacterized membrane protein